MMKSIGEHRRWFAGGAQISINSHLLWSDSFSLDAMTCPFLFFCVYNAWQRINTPGISSGPTILCSITTLCLTNLSWVSFAMIVGKILVLAMLLTAQHARAMVVSLDASMQRKKGNPGYLIKAADTSIVPTYPKYQSYSEVPPPEPVDQTIAQPPIVNGDPYSTPTWQSNDEGSELAQQDSAKSDSSGNVSA